MSGEPLPPHSQELLISRVTGELAHARTKPLAPALYLVATPIGNLSDITIRALAVLSSADTIYVEDTRHSGKLLSHYGISTPMRAYHEHNAERERPKIISALLEGKRVALISDAGTPLISDPGFKLVRDVIAAGAIAISIPGPSAVLAALCASGLPTHAFQFVGFLPAKQGERCAKLNELKKIAATLVFFESPTRVEALLNDLSEAFGERQGVVARELTKLHEEIVRAPLPKLYQKFKNTTVKGECVVLVGPPPKTTATDEEIVERLTVCLDDMSLRDAAREVADEMSVAKGRVYDLGLKMKTERLSSRDQQ